MKALDNLLTSFKGVILKPFVILCLSFLIFSAVYSNDSDEWPVNIKINNPPIQTVQVDSFKSEKWEVGVWSSNLEETSLKISNTTHKLYNAVFEFRLEKEKDKPMIEGITAQNSSVEIGRMARNIVILVKDILKFDNIYYYPEFEEIYDKKRILFPGTYNFHLWMINIDEIDTVGYTMYSFRVEPNKSPYLEYPANNSTISADMPEFSWKFDPITETEYEIKIWEKFISQDLETALKGDPVFSRKLNSNGFLLMETDFFKHGQIYITQVEAVDKSGWTDYADSSKSNINSFIFIDETKIKEKGRVPIYLSDTEKLLLKQFLIENDKGFEYYYNNYDFQYIFDIDIEEVGEIIKFIKNGKIIYVDEESRKK